MNLGSSANLIDWSSLQVMTIGLMNQALSQFFNFLMCFLDSNQLNLVLTESIR